MIKKILFIFVIFVFCLCIMGSKKEKAEILNASLFQTSYYEDVNINKVISSKQELIDFLNIYDGFSKEELTIINDTYNFKISTSTSLCSSSPREDPAHPDIPYILNEWHSTIYLTSSLY